MIVLDASVALAYLLDDETTPAVRAAVDLLVRQGAWVVSFWHIEVANALEMAVRRKRINKDQHNAWLADLRQWPIRVDDATERHAWTSTKALAERYRLTYYDAAYLELSLRLEAPLATLDRQLRTAAMGERVLLLGL